MKPALWMVLAAAALPLAAQTDLEREYRAQLAAQPQPVWLGWRVPAARTSGLGCDYNREGSVVHLEPPKEAIVLFRIEGGRVERIRTLSGFCEPEAGDVPIRWLKDVQPAQSVALLATLATEGNSALNAIAMHADPSADQVLERFLDPKQPEAIRLRVVQSIGWRPNALPLLKKVIASDPDIRVRERAVSSLANSKQPEALELLTSIAKSGDDARLRTQAVSGLGRKSGAAIVATLTSVIDKDADPNVRRRAISALQSMPDSEGVPVLIELARSQRDVFLRKDAMNSLKNSRDPRALAFFEEVIKK